MSQGKPYSWTFVGILALLWLGILQPAAAQIAEADLPPDSYQQLAYESIPFEELQKRFEKAEAAFVEELNPERALPLFADLIEVLDGRLEGPIEAGTTARDPRDFDLLARCLGYSVRINFNLGGDSNVEEDLHRLLELNPAFEFDTAIISPKLLQHFESLKKKTVGKLALTLEPPDAEVLVDGRPVDPSRGPVAVPAGTRSLVVRRPGYRTVEMVQEVLPGKELPMGLTLERESAMVLLVSRPVDAQVFIDGEPVGVTSGALPDDYPLSGDAAKFSREEFSSPTKIGGLTVGPHRIEVRKDGFRPFRFEVSIPELKDFNAGVALLEPTGGLVILRGLPRGAQVSLGGRAVRTVPINRTDGQLTLAPGNYRIGVTDGASGFFRVEFSLADQQTVEVSVELRPALTLLGILGGDRPAAAKLGKDLRQATGALERWTFLNRTEEGEALLAAHGFQATPLRAAAAGGSATGRTPEPDWVALQKAADEKAQGSVYVVAVLSDDLIADAADLWFLPSAPAPARPDRRSIPLADSGPLERLVEAFNQPFELQKAWFGASLIDSTAADGPVVAALNPKGPAAKAGVRLGDEILAIYGEKVGSAAAAQAVLQGLRPLSSFSVDLASSAGRRTVDVDLGTSPAAVPLDSTDLIYAAISASLAAEAEDEESVVPAWLRELNRAAVFLHGGAWEEAVRVLRAIQAPKGPGLGQGMVDYWLAIALNAVSPEYEDQARQALERAAADPGARLFHNDGPLVAPRARARLLGLGGG